MNKLYVTILISWSAIICTANGAAITPPAGYQSIEQKTDQPIGIYEYITKPQNTERYTGNSDADIDSPQFVIAVIEMKAVDENTKDRISLDSSKPAGHQYENPKENEIASQRNKRDIDYYDNDDDDDFQTADTRVFRPYIRYRTVSGQRFYINRRYDSPHYPAMVGYADNTDRFPTVA